MSRNMSANEALEKLNFEWKKYIEQQFVGNFQTRVGNWLFSCETMTDDYCDTMSRSISHLYDDWLFFDNFNLEIISSDSAIQKRISDLSMEVGRAIEECGYGINYFRSSHKLLSLLVEYRGKTNEFLKKETGLAMENSVKLKFMNYFYSNNIRKIMEPIARNVRLIKCAHALDNDFDKQLDVLLNNLVRITRYLHETTFVLRQTDPFRTHIQDVVGKIVFHSFDLWTFRHIKEIAEVKAATLINSAYQIDPTNQEFMNLFLSFQYRILDHLQCFRSNDNRLFVKRFCNYLVTDVPENSLQEIQDFREELMSMIDLYIPLYPIKSFCEDTSPLFEEIDAMLREISTYPSFEPQENESDHISKTLRVQMLKMELIIKRYLVADDEFLTVDSILMNLNFFVTYLSCLPRFREEINKEVESFTKMVQGPPIQSKNQNYFLKKCSLQRLLFRIIFFKVDFSLKCKRDDVSLAPSVKSQIMSMEKELAIIKRFAMKQTMCTSSEEEITCIQIEQLVRRIYILSGSMILFLPEFSNEVKHFKAKLTEIIPPFPRIWNLGFIKFLCKNVTELLIYNPVFIAPLKSTLIEVKKQLELLGRHVLDFEHKNGELNDHIRETTHELEYVVESIEFDSHSKYLFLLPDLLEDITSINKQVKFCEPSFRSKAAPLAPSVMNETMRDIVVVERSVIDQLMRGSKNREVVSIVGMAGIGKTTLAKKLCNNRNVMNHFPQRAWCSVSKGYTERALLFDILSDIRGITKELHQMTDSDLQELVRHSLLDSGHRYLVVMDDVWDVAAWNFLQICFPDKGNGSRILMTSRFQNLHSVIQPKSHPHCMHILSDKESWTLLEKMIFEEPENCPNELIKVGKEISKHCQGLPLSIVTIAGLLRTTEKIPSKWENISKSICKMVLNDLENQCKKILEVSYDALPEDLKPCFLYLGVFLGDKDIPVSKLLQLWIAEGIIESKNLEDDAYSKLMELINRSLVIVSKRCSNGKVKTCHLHDILRELCQSRAKDENFFNLVTRDDEPYSTFVAYENDPEFQMNRKPVCVTFEDYRLSVSLRRKHFFDSISSGPRTRSLLFFAILDKEPRRPCEISFIWENFRLLRVLDFECINIKECLPDEIGLMVQLRYLAVSGYLRSVPKSIVKLWKLQLLAVRSFEDMVILPNTLWSMKNLRHLLVNEHVTFDLQGVGKDDQLENLVNFCTPSLSFGEKTSELLSKKLPNLVNLRCIFLKSGYSSKSSNQFPNLEFLTRLESLKIIYSGRANKLGEFFLPISLMKLTLSEFHLPWKSISRIGGLPNLKVLKLLLGAFEGPRWEMNEDEFKKLEFLKLEDLDIAEWDASSDHLPNLIKLVLRNCKKLEEIPEDFASIDTLEMIQVQWCNDSVEESAKSIGDVAEAIKVDISYN